MFFICIYAKKVVPLCPILKYAHTNVSKRYKYIVFLLLLLSHWMVALASTTRTDSLWLGGRTTYNTTEGHDFWLTFMNNGMFDATKTENKNTPFEMTILLSSQDTV